jgi:hypothetical protein
MRRSILACLIVALASVSCSALGYDGQANAISTQTTWMTVMLGGRKIGSLQVDRDRTSQSITTTQQLSIQFNRKGKPLQLSSMSRTTETRDGEPLAFAASSSLSAMGATTESHWIAARTFEVRSTVGGKTTTSMLLLAPDAVMFDGQRRAMETARKSPGSEYVLHQFDPASQQTMTVRVQVIGDEEVKLPEGPRTLSHQRQRLALPGGEQVVDLWVDPQGVPLKGQFKLLGESLQMLACSRECAQAPAESIDMFRSAMVDSPRPLTPNLRIAPLTYRIHLLDGDTGLIATTDEQHVRRLGPGDLYLDVGNAQPGYQSAPSPEDTAPTAWLQSDAAEIKSLADSVVKHADSNQNQMRRLRSFVSDYVSEHGLDVGYASALEVLHSRKGDCTEYAVLLAAMARARQIPARVVTGMAYADRYGGSLRVFVPHAWVQAWIGDRWESYDAALRRFDATHIALATGDGDPSKYFGATRLFGLIQIESIEPTADLMRNHGPVAAPAPPVAGSTRE